MPRIPEYTSETDRITPTDIGYTANEYAGRRIGALYNEAGTDIRRAAAVTAAAKTSGMLFPFDIEALKQNGSRGVNLHSGGGGGGRQAAAQIGSGGPNLAALAHGLVDKSIPGREQEQDRRWDTSAASKKDLADYNTSINEWAAKTYDSPMYKPATTAELDKKDDPLHPADFSGGADETSSSGIGAAVSSAVSSTANYLTKDWSAFIPDFSTASAPTYDSTNTGTGE